MPARSIEDEVWGKGASGGRAAVFRWTIADTNLTLAGVPDLRGPWNPVGKGMSGRRRNSVSRVEINSSAPVVGRSEAVVEAPVELVWEVLSDFEAWPTWNKSVSQMHLSGPLAVGTSFRWVGGGSRIDSRLEEIVCPTRIVWSGRTLGIKAVHVWEFLAGENGTRVRTEESFDGLLARILPGFMGKMLAKALRDGVGALKAEAEARHRGKPA